MWITGVCNLAFLSHEILANKSQKYNHTDISNYPNKLNSPVWPKKMVNAMHNIPIS